MKSAAGCDLVDERIGKDRKRWLPSCLEQAEGGGAGVDEHRAQPGDQVVQKQAQVATRSSSEIQAEGRGGVAPPLPMVRLSIHALTSVVLP